MKRKKKNKIELIICSTISLIIMLLIYVSFSWSSYTKLSQLKEIRISGSSIISDKEYSSKLEPLKGVELEEINLREVSILLESHPYVKAAREPLSYVGINSVGLRRRGFKSSKIVDIQNIYRILYQKKYNNTQALEIIAAELSPTPERDEIIQFIENSQRGIMKGYFQRN